jgi:hypothetical protein
VTKVSSAIPPTFNFGTWEQQESHNVCRRRQRGGRENGCGVAIRPVIGTPLSCEPQSDVIYGLGVGCSRLRLGPWAFMRIGSRSDRLPKIAQCAPKLVQRPLIQTCRLNGEIRPLGVPAAS